MSQAPSDFSDDFGAIEYDGQQTADVSPQVAPGPVYRKKGINTYTVLLIISFLLLTAGAIVLFSKLGNYNL
jgi:hypothetical protein